MNRSAHTFVVGILTVSGWLLSGAFHEIGHAIVAKLAGLEIVNIQPWALAGRVHVGLEGETTRSWYAAIHISGMLLNVLIGICGTIGASLLAQKWRRAIYAVWLFIPMICQSLAWAALPLAIMLGVRTPRDDVTKFMQQTGWPALVVLVIGMALVAICAAVLKWSFNRRRAE